MKFNCTDALACLEGTILGLLLGSLLAVFAGCDTPSPGVRIDEAFIQCVALQFQLQPSNKVTTSQNRTKAEFPQRTDTQGLTKPDSKPDETGFFEKSGLSGAPRGLDMVRPATTKQPAAASDGTIDAKVADAPSEIAKPAAEKRAAEAQQPKPLFQSEIILHTRPTCQTCPAAKKALEDARIEFTEHTVSDKELAPVAFIDGIEYQGFQILDRLKLPRPIQKPTRLKGHSHDRTIAH